MNVLLAEADEGLRETLRVALEDEGCVVTEAVDGLDALHHLRTDTQPTIVLLNHRLPRLSGVEVLRALANASFQPVQRAYVLLSTCPWMLDHALADLSKSLPVLVVELPFELEQLKAILIRAHRACARVAPTPTR